MADKSNWAAIIDEMKSELSLEGLRNAGLKRMREPFAANQISKLPKPTRSQTEAVKANYKKGIRCQVCGGWHHPDVIHLDYVGHAALTDRLLECDPAWNWEPFSMTNEGLPLLDRNGGIWIKLTVCGVTRNGYGHADGKSGGDAIKEAIGDALRNAAMRFGAALDLWHKGDLHVEVNDDESGANDVDKNPPQRASKANSRGLYSALQNGLRNQKSADALQKWGKRNADDIKSLPTEWAEEIRKEYQQELEAFQHVENAEAEKEQMNGHAA